MRIAVVKTVDGPVYYSTTRNAHKYAAVRMLLDQLEEHGDDLFDMEGDERLVMARRLRDAIDPFQLAVDEQLILVEDVREG